MIGQAIAGPDGVVRCPWCVGAADYMAYHDTEWGRPVRGDTAIFERISLEAFQSGLSWLTILRKRPAFRLAFADFEPSRVASFGRADVARLMADAGIVRNHRKIEATIANARAVVGLLDAEGHGALDALFWSFEPRGRSHRPAAMTDVPVRTDASRALGEALKSRGIGWVGPTTMYAAMQACGVVDDHLMGCSAASD